MGMKTISLPHGLSTLVDDETFEMFGHMKWHVANVGYVGREDVFSDGIRRKIFLHRLVVIAPEKLTVHHIDGDIFNNQSANLKIMTKTAHNRLHRAVEGPVTGRYRGIWQRKDTEKWQASITAVGGKITIGCFESEEEAARAWDQAALQYFGPGCYQNFPGPPPG